MKKVKSIYGGLITAVVLATVPMSAYAAINNPEHTWADILVCLITFGIVC